MLALMDKKPSKAIYVFFMPTVLWVICGTYLGVSHIFFDGCIHGGFGGSKVCGDAASYIKYALLVMCIGLSIWFTFVMLKDYKDKYGD